MRISKAEDFVYRAVETGELVIDSEGRVWRLAARRGNRWTRTTHLIPCPPRRAEHDTGEYLTVRVMIDRRRVEALAHRLVYRHFKGPIPDGLTINHENGHKKENHPGNLEPATLSEQAIHAITVLGFRPELNFLG